MKYLLFSDIHCDIKSCELIIQKSKYADFVIGAGDYAMFRKGLTHTIEALSPIKKPVILVPGNHETTAELSDACRGLSNFHILHGNSVQVNGVIFLGIGHAIPITPFIPWSVDLSETDAKKILQQTFNIREDINSPISTVASNVSRDTRSCVSTVASSVLQVNKALYNELETQKHFVFITHSPPFGCLDIMHNNKHIGSKSIRAFIEETKPQFVVCGHIHERWNQTDEIKNIPIINAGPKGYEFIY